MSFIKKILYSAPVIGYRRWQWFFERLYNFSLGGMNIGRAAGIYDDGEIGVFNYVDSHIKEKTLTIFDVGANVGLYTEALFKQFGEKASIYSFEPSKKTFATLSQNISSNIGNKKSVHLCNIGLGEKESDMILFSDKDNSGLASLYDRKMDHFNVSMDKMETVKISTIDIFCRDNNIKNIDFLKMDVEGHELSVLHGAKDMLAKKAIKYIQFEFGGNNIDSRTFFQDFYYLLKDDFNLFRVVKDGLYPVFGYKEDYERFLCTVFFAERK